MDEQESLNDLKTIITKGTDNFLVWVKNNPEKTSDILKAHYQLFLTEIMQNHIYEFEDD